MRHNFYRQVGKRAVDIILAVLGIIFVLPIILIVGLVVLITDGPPVFFRQIRVGKNFKEFELLKFRTMKVDNKKSGALITGFNDVRVTKVGSVLRKYKIDELPQLWNVIRGDISLVGPRPEVSKYVNYYKKEYEEILKLKPGITDFAAIEFRNEASLLKNKEDVEKAYVEIILPQKISLYKKYLTKLSFKTDIYILILTVWRVFR